VLSTRRYPIAEVGTMIRGRNLEYDQLHNEGLFGKSSWVSRSFNPLRVGRRNASGANVAGVFRARTSWRDGGSCGRGARSNLARSRGRGSGRCA